MFCRGTNYTSAVHYNNVKIEKFVAGHFSGQHIYIYSKGVKKIYFQTSTAFDRKPVGGEKNDTSGQSSFSLSSAKSID